MTNPAVFFVPHQDDELLSMGAYILQHIEAGRDIVVVLITDGQASGARNLLISDGYPMSFAAFSKARDREFLSGLRRLGVPNSNIFFENLEDGTLTKGVVKQVMKKYLTAYGPGSYKTMSWMDAHRDHFVLGRSLDELNREGLVPNGDARFCRSLNYQDAPTPGGSWQRAADNTRLYDAANEYSVWDLNLLQRAEDMSSGPRYGIGWRSVAGDFRAMLADPKCWVHADSSGYSSAGRSAANDWLWGHGQPAYL